MSEGMPGLLVVSHGHLAEEFVRAANMIVGPVETMEAVSIGWDDDVDEARRRIEAALGRIGRRGPVLILTDMFGGTASNLAHSLLEPGRIDVVTGVNLAMLIKFCNLRGQMPFEDVARTIADQGRTAIQVASELLRKRRAGEEGSGR